MKRKDIERVHNGYLERKTWKPFEDVVQFSYAFTIHSDLLNKLSDKASEKYNDDRLINAYIIKEVGKLIIKKHSDENI